MKFSASVFGAVCGLTLMGAGGAHAMPFDTAPDQPAGTQVTDVQFYYGGGPSYGYEYGPSYGYGGWGYGHHRHRGYPGEALDQIYGAPPGYFEARKRYIERRDWQQQQDYDEY